MFSLLKSRKTLLTATILLLSSVTQPAFAFACMSKPGNTPAECAKLCAWTAVGGPLAYALCY